MIDKKEFKHSVNMISSICIDDREIKILLNSYIKHKECCKIEYPDDMIEILESWIKRYRI